MDLFWKRWPWGSSRDGDDPNAAGGISSSEQAILSDVLTSSAVHLSELVGLKILQPLTAVNSLKNPSLQSMSNGGLKQNKIRFDLMLHISISDMPSFHTTSNREMKHKSIQVYESTIF